MGAKKSRAADEGSVERHATSPQPEEPAFVAESADVAGPKEFEAWRGPVGETALEKSIESSVARSAAFDPARLFPGTSVLAAVGRMQSDLTKIVLPNFAKLVGQDFSMITGAGSSAAVVAANLRWIDQVTPPSSYVAQFNVTARIAQQVLGSGALSSWRSALAANSLIEARLYELSKPSPMYSELARISRAQVELTDWVVSRAPGTGLLGATSGRPLGLWRDFVSDSVNRDELPVVITTGRSNLSLLGSDLLTSGEADPELIAEGADRVEAEVIEPWTAARQKATAELYAVLARIDPELPQLLNGAWDEIARNGPAAVVKAASCAVEAVDRTLRATAPDAAVLAWHAEAGRSSKELEGKARPPHPLRVRYLLRDLPGPRDLVVHQVEAFASVVGRLRGRLEAAKHASQGDVVAVQALVIQAESLLVTLLVGLDDPKL